MSQKNKKNQITMMLLNQLLLLTDKRQTLYILLHPHKDNQSAILNFLLKVPKDQSLKVNTCQSNHQLVKIEDFQFSKTMSHKDTRLTMQDQFNNLHLIRNRILLINKDMMSHMSQSKLLNMLKTKSQQIDTNKNKTMSHYLPDLKNLSFKDQCLQLKDPNLKVNKTISKLKEIKFHLEKIKLLINFSQNLN